MNHTPLNIEKLVDRWNEVKPEINKMTLFFFQFMNQNRYNENYFMQATSVLHLKKLFHAKMKASGDVSSPGFIKGAKMHQWDIIYDSIQDRQRLQQFS